MAESLPSIVNGARPGAGKKRKLMKAVDEAMGALGEPQRIYLDALMESVTKMEARVKLLVSTGREYDRATCWRWAKSKKFQKALSLRRVLALEDAGITKNGVLLKTQALLGKAMENKPILYKGEPTGFYEYDSTTAAKMIELQGRHLRVWGTDDNAAKAVVHVDIDFTGRRDKEFDIAVTPETLDTKEAVEGVWNDVTEDESWLD